MKMLPDTERKKLRLKDYNYSRVGYYYITICTQNRLCLFGAVSNKIMNLNDSGKMVYDVLIKFSKKFNSIFIDTFVIMPNHLHLIMVLTEECSAIKISLSTILQNFKTYTTNCYIKGVKDFGWQPFEKRLWQRSFYEHIIRSDESLANIRQYIIDNPEQWEQDQENPNWDDTMVVPYKTYFI
jgi:putative transposase